MADKHAVHTGACYAIGAKELDALLRCNDADAVLVYLWLLKNGAQVISAVSESLAFSAERTQAAINKLSAIGLMAGSATAVEYDQPAEYSASDITSELEGNNGFKWLTDDMQRRLGRVFSTADISIVLRIHKWIGLPAEVIGMLTTYCIDETRRKNGEGRIPTLRQIEKEALVWEANGVLSIEKADEYVKRMQSSHERRTVILHALGLNDAPPTVAKYIDQWLDWGYEEDAILHALDLTVKNTGGLKFAYMNSIIRNWQEKNLFTLDTIQRKDKKVSPMNRLGQPGQREKDIVSRNQRYQKGE